VTDLAPGSTVLVVKNVGTFTTRYGSGFNIAGEYTGALDNAGETIRLEDAVGEKILAFAYRSSWYPVTDGFGFSLVIMDENAPWYTWGDKRSWRASADNDGSAGMNDVVPNIPTILINELLTHTDLPEVDAIESIQSNRERREPGRLVHQRRPEDPEEVPYPRANNHPGGRLPRVHGSGFQSDAGRGQEFCVPFHGRRSVVVFGRRGHKPDRVLAWISFRRGGEWSDLRPLREQRG
jgi:hypothetical protein